MGIANPLPNLLPTCALPTGPVAGDHFVLNQIISAKHKSYSKSKRGFKEDRIHLALPEETRKDPPASRLNTSSVGERVGLPLIKRNESGGEMAHN